jgi:hypothetical protein
MFDDIGIIGEYITDLLLWKDHKGICGIQLSTSQGRTSRHFGSGGGSPQILRSSGGCLSAFSGLLQNGIIYELQVGYINRRLDLLTYVCILDHLETRRSRIEVKW